jgi:hypothetical protein
VSRIQCDVLLYAGKWSPRHSDRLKDNVRHALFRMCDRYGDICLRAVELEPLPTVGDGPRAAVHITADWSRCDDHELFGDFVHEALVFHLGPECESQIEVERTEIIPACGDRNSEHTIDYVSADP